MLHQEVESKRKLFLLLFSVCVYMDVPVCIYIYRLTSGNSFPSPFFSSSSPLFSFSFFNFSFFPLLISLFSSICDVCACDKNIEDGIEGNIYKNKSNGENIKDNLLISICHENAYMNELVSVMSFMCVHVHLTFKTNLFLCLYNENEINRIPGWKIASE